MIISGPIEIKWKNYILTIKDISIDPEDRSVGIFSETIVNFEITNIRHKSGKKKTIYFDDVTETVYAHFSNNDKEGEKIEEKIFNELYKLQKVTYKEAWKRARKKGYKGSYRTWESEYT